MMNVANGERDVKMKGTFTVDKAFNNNVIVARSESGEEVIFIGKGIGFGKKPGDVLSEQKYEKVFILADQEEQEKYIKLLAREKQETLLIIHEAIEKIREWMGVELHERIHFALAQHLVLALERSRNGTEIHNPFLTETKWLYHETYRISQQVVAFLYEKTTVQLPEAETGFITLHIQSAIGREFLSKKESGDLIDRCVSYAEEKAGVSFNKEGVHFQRFVQHLHEMIERSMTNEYPIEKKMIHLLKEENSLCYNISRNIVRMIEKSIQQSISGVEIVFLSIHLQRIIAK
ncbi:transcriptional antiterminator [Evansella caseinilytica]|uniref:Transcriptional antiterminator n=1 Tax=Evansella caseinilytica TaxID=1503961 RepID=A0A1H3UZY3_9BACI|nr:PRD domain-containing protein [Evansella caseinilytica]SDZ67541.1 transcriptional antiterminator [Evansella caseinilytica]